MPAWKILAGEKPTCTASIVFVGTSAPGLLDLAFHAERHRQSPASEIHAQIVEQILTDDLIERPLWADDDRDFWPC